jgi:two-component system, NtrC family, nitrogen regulation response regulator NtrX
MAKILIVDDEVAIRRVLKDILETNKYEVHEAADGMDAIARLKQTKFDVVFMDIKMPKLDGLEALDRIQNICPEVPVIMISGHADVHTAITAVKKGAFDFIQKPLDLNRLLITLRNALDKFNLVGETKSLKRKVSQHKTQEIIGVSTSINEVKEMIEVVAPTEARVLVLGPNGSGKELVARWMHEKSARREQSLVEVNCAAIPSELIESELFGHMKGSFTGAVKDYAGKFEQANGGTLFLDEIGDLSLPAQAKMLRALQEHKVSRIGSDKDITVNVRIIAATNKDLIKEIAMGNFREDLYYRLAVIVAKVPSLNERRSDIPMLVEHFIEKYCEETGDPLVKIGAEAMGLLQNRDWSGNIRELRNVVERLMILGSKPEITPDDVRRLVLAIDQHMYKRKKGTSQWAELFDMFDDADALHEYIDEEFAKHKGLVFA